MVIIDFYAQYTFGQWAVISLIGMIFLGILCALTWFAEGGGSNAIFGFVWGAILYWLLLIALTVILAIISACQWLWSL